MLSWLSRCDVREAVAHPDFPTMQADDAQRIADHTAVSTRIGAVKERLEFLQDSGFGPFGLRLQRDVRRLMRLLSREDSVDIVVLASRLALVGYNISVRTALGGGPSCFRNLRHEFLSVTGTDEYKETELIVDPNFKEQFEIPQPTATYRAVLNMVPQEFVGTASRLVPLVQLLCAEMAASFEAMSLTLPPWRRAQSMLSKWLPSRSRDISISTTGSTHSNTSCCSDSEGCSPTGCSSGSTSSPFSRISDLAVADRVTRQNSSKSLLSGKLSSLPSSSVISRSSSNVSNNSSSSRSFTGPVRVPIGGLLQQQQQQLPIGTVSMQPPVFKGQPPTYKVKMAPRGF
eukprot:GHUV01002475.1.p1 GENE.GHUV01002475.1~~GHUV01002475.1.p1  ORF type:complete len:344 (+),score=116.81 GHUV01002475.1:340-1371(+)